MQKLPRIHHGIEPLARDQHCDLPQADVAAGDFPLRESERYGFSGAGRQAGGCERIVDQRMRADEKIDPDWICYLMGKSYTHPLESHPKWLPFLKARPAKPVRTFH